MNVHIRAGLLGLAVMLMLTQCSSPVSTPAPVPLLAVIPAETDSFSPETAESSAEAEKISAETEVIPAEAEDIPAETEVIPAEAEDIPAETEVIPAETEEIPAETEVIPAETEPVIPSASPVSSLVPMTGDVPIIEIRTHKPSLTPQERSGRIVIPSLIGFRETDLPDLHTEGFTLELSYDWYPLPEGVIYAASFTGEMTEEEFCLLPGSVLTLHVSRGMGAYISVLSEPNKTIYLTFDDGPHHTNTESILDTLDEYGIKATFFTVGSYAARYPEILRATYERGHKIGCHSYTHNYSYIYRSADNMMAEVELWENAVKEALGFIPPQRLFRYPGGTTSCSSTKVYNALLKAGYRIFDWNALNNDCLLHTRPENISELDFMKQSVIDTVAYSFRLESAPHILLMHDSYAQTAELLPWVIEYLQSLGCTFATPDTLPAGWHY